MRVALVSRNFGLSGSAERNIVLLARELVALGVQVHCYCNPATRTAAIPGVSFRDVRPALVSRSRLGYPSSWRVSPSPRHAFSAVSAIAST